MTDPTQTPAVICLNDAGLQTAQAIASTLDAELHGLKGRVDAPVQFEETVAHLQALFAAGRPIIGVCASGILIRAVAPLLKDKWAEPPVLAVTQDGDFVVPLLGGHRGANGLAARLTDALEEDGALLFSEPVITTASDQELLVALDDIPEGWRFVGDDLAADAILDVKRPVAALLSGASAKLEGATPEWLTAPLQATLGERLELKASDSLIARLSVKGVETALSYAPMRLCIGVGCERGAPAEELRALVSGALQQAELPAAAIAGVFSIDLKADEAAVNALAGSFAGSLTTTDGAARFFSADRLEQETPRLKNPSDVVFQEVGCHGVAEAAALAAAGPEGVLLVEKQKSERCTVAIALAPAPMVETPGLARGKLSVVGIGPGEERSMTHHARQTLSAAEELVGYHLYIDIAGYRDSAKVKSKFELGEEEARCRYALEQAAKGQHVALVCSGDGGIYAMGALVLELLDRDESQGGVSAAAKRVEIESVPGVSALQAASAKAGALLGHDFCTISLSDLLTPWETIERRLHAAAEGDFVIAFYNPVSKRRRTQLARAKEILLKHRPAETPVLLASELGRPAETLRRRSLATLEVDEVDMLTVVLVGSSQSKAFQTGDVSAAAEGWRMYTPRGYAKKIDG